MINRKSTSFGVRHRQIIEREIDSILFAVRLDAFKNLVSVDAENTDFKRSLKKFLRANDKDLHQLLDSIENSEIDDQSVTALLNAVLPINFDDINGPADLSVAAVPYIDQQIMEALKRNYKIREMAKDLSQIQASLDMYTIDNFPFYGNLSLPEDERAAKGTIVMMAVSQIAGLYPNVVLGHNNNRSLSKIHPIKKDTVSSKGAMHPFDVHSDCALTNPNESLEVGIDDRPTHIILAGIVGNPTATTTLYDRRAVLEELKQDYPEYYECLKQNYFTHHPSEVVSKNREPVKGSVIVPGRFGDGDEIKVNLAKLNPNKPNLRTQIRNDLLPHHRKLAEKSLEKLHELLNKNQYAHDFCVATGRVVWTKNDPHSRSAFEGERYLIRYNSEQQKNNQD